ncbi:putative DNA-binding protein ESCAROLA [Acorus gramineus]|uniref:AT-hook motif nuclear-localized protein n=1 Tax=Acorus gramineus TaxID=55184 RepID=A0AAV9BP85_ACOGR|nr:putative DNA-binding protein ESCAROLA [Acorus gramineus]
MADFGAADAERSSAIVVAKKPRGRPPGSKNKPKPPVVVTTDGDAAMRPAVLELAAGTDVVEAVSAFARRRRLGISVLSGSGAVSNVTLRHPTSASSVLTLHGRFDILSLSGTLFPPSAAGKAPPPLAISLAGGQGQVIGGTIAGSLTAAGTVVLIVASFQNPTFHRLSSADEEVEEEAAASAVKEGEEEGRKGGKRGYSVSAGEGGSGAATSSSLFGHFEAMAWVPPPVRPPHHPF